MDRHESAEEPKIALGASACLLGQRVRYDGGHKASRTVRERLTEVFDLVPICPEIAVGLGIPRPPIRLQSGADGALRAQGVEVADLDPSEDLRTLGRRLSEHMGHLSGYLFKARSPSCGLFDVPVFMPDGAKREDGRGLYARAFTDHRPYLPVEDEGRLLDPRHLDNFVERVVFLRRWQQMSRLGVPSASALIDFHSRHKFQFMAHDQAGYRRLGRWVAEVGSVDLRQRVEEYLCLAMATLSNPATRGNHVNALDHLAGFFKSKELHMAIRDYENRRAALLPVLDMLRELAIRGGRDYVGMQSYLNPHPAERRLRVWE